MRWFYLTIIVVLAAAALVFAFQNMEIVTMSFLNFAIRAPLAVLIVVVYLVGAVTGGSLFALLHRLFERSRLRASTS